MKNSETLIIENNLACLDEAQKNAYKVLTEKCLSENAKKNDVLVFIDTLKDYEGHDEYISTFNYILDFFRHNGIPFILMLDWKADIEDLAFVLKTSLRENFNLFIDLPEPKDYEEGVSISYDNVLEDFDQPLRDHGLQMGFIDTESDEYLIVLHKEVDIEEVENAINEIGFEYFEV